MDLLITNNSKVSILLTNVINISKNKHQNKPPSGSPHHKIEKLSFNIETCAEINFKISFI